MARGLFQFIVIFRGQKHKGDAQMHGMLAHLVEKLETAHPSTHCQYVAKLLFVTHDHAEGQCFRLVIASDFELELQFEN